jgi:hypothetical protein
MDRFPESKVSYRVYPDAQILTGRKNRKPNLSLEATGGPVKLDEPWRDVWYPTCMREMQGLPFTTGAPSLSRLGL